MNSNVQTSCRLCSSPNLNPLTIGSIQLIKCLSCGITYLSTFPDASVLEQYYEQGYILSTGDSTEIERRRLFRSTEQLELVSILMKYVSAPARILDVGCDKGYFIDVVRRFGYSTSGVEPSLESRTYCKSIGQSVFENLNDVDAKYDATVMWHSLEHFTDPVSALNQIHELLNENAIIMVRVPNFDSIWRKIFGSRWIWFQPNNHYFHFNLESLEKLFISNGFEIIKIFVNKPNNRTTRKLFRLSNKIFEEFFEGKTSIKKKIGRIYEDITGSEVFLIARMKQKVGEND